MKTYIYDSNGISIRASAEEPLYPQVQILFQAIETTPHEKLKNGFSFEVGFSIFYLIEKSGDYCIVAPDYKKDPFSDTTEDLTIALWMQLEQTHLLRLYNLQWEDVRFDDKIIVAKNALHDGVISMQRFSDCSKGDSGWCVKSVDNCENEEYEAFFAYQLLEFRPALIKALALPYEYLVVFEGDRISAILNELDIDIMQA